MSIWTATDATTRRISAHDVDEALMHLETIADTIPGARLSEPLRDAAEGWAAYQHAGARQRGAELVDAILDGDAERAEALHNEALLVTLSTTVQHNGTADAALRNVVAGGVLSRVQKLYLEHDADHNVAAAREAFNALAEQYAAACEKINPLVEPEAVLDMSAAKQNAWKKARDLEKDLTAAHLDLSIALDAAGRGGDVDPAQVFTAASLNACPLRDLLDAWSSPRPWPAMVAAGAELGAEEYDGKRRLREPRELQCAFEATERGTTLQHHLDPEDAAQREKLAALTGQTLRDLELPNVV